MTRDKLVLLLCITTFLSYLPEAGEYSCFFVYLRLIVLNPELAKFACPIWKLGLRFPEKMVLLRIGVFGLLMGSLISPLLANEYMYKLDREFDQSRLQARVLLRYLDDYFALWSHAKENVNEFLNFINQLDERIKFTMEAEENERLPFLYTEVMRSNGTL
ncbi:unnamed protein product [Protopolystoma xenopodis]|uniref:Reverse transcriptase domain-containing protein n=1 Tax=Protopolystoma xenopodis TaxID=117903 RepID=A0A3S4ZQ82_9PLAT|nr:unnamed protein product [Protopolystoma xenopodis]